MRKTADELRQAHLLRSVRTLTVARNLKLEVSEDTDEGEISFTPDALIRGIENIAAAEKSAQIVSEKI